MVSKRHFRSLCIVLLLLLAMVQVSNGRSRKSLSTARRASTYSTIIPLVVGGGAILIAPYGVGLIGGMPVGGIGLIWGPSIGHAYAGNTGRFFTSSSLRLLCAMGTTGGIYMFYGGMLNEYGRGEGLVVGGIVLSAASFSALVYTVVRDFTDLDDSVRDYNQWHGFSSLSLEPAYLVHHKAAGLALTFRF